MTNSGTFCENCGAELQDDSRFCENCGQQADAGRGPAAPPTATAQTSAGAACSVCGKADQVVAAAAYDPKADPKITGDDDREDADTVALFLEKPDYPEPKSVVLWVLAPLVPTVIFFIYWFAPIHQGIKFFLFGLTIAFWVSVFEPTMAAMSLYPFLGILLMLFYWGALFIGRNRRKDEYLTVRIPQYNVMLARWEHLQYCRRCRRVWFDNASTAPVGVTETEALLKG